MNEHDTEQGTRGRAVKVYAYGTDLPSLEMAALDGAREFFGPDARLEVIPDYEATRLAVNEPGKRFAADVKVREIAP